MSRAQHALRAAKSGAKLQVGERAVVAPGGDPHYKGGYKKGYDRGFHSGYQSGLLRGRCEAETLFDGVSIVIPIPAQAALPTACLDSIGRHTVEKHEVIVIRAGSRDALQTERQDIRYRSSLDKAGFAGAVNQGLKMARGKMVLVLKEETAVSPDWLGGLTATGEQRFELPAGCRLLMKREALESIGYFDESFGAGGDDEEDFALRARLLGLELTMEKDMRPDRANGESAAWLQKWGDIQTHEERHNRSGGNSIRSTDLYPTHVVVRGAGNAIYWIEHGVRHPVNGEWPLAATRISQLDLRQLPKGDAWTVEQAAQRLATLSSTPSPFGTIAEGLIVRTDSGGLFQSDRGTLRRLIGNMGLTAWHLDRRPAFWMTEKEAASRARGLPIIAPPVLLQQNL